MKFKKFFRRLKRIKPINFLRNVWAFKRELSEFYWWDYHYTLDMMRRSLKIMSDRLEVDGLEVDSSRMKKVQKIRRAIQIIENFSHGIKHIEMAEAEVGNLATRAWEWEDSPDQPQYKRLIDNLTTEEREHNQKVFARTREIEESEWNELWEIFKGQDHSEYKDMEYPEWDEWFDGSGMRGWWD